VSVFEREYRSQADYCVHMAERAPTRGLREDWLRLAGKWLQMIADSQAASGRPHQSEFASRRIGSERHVTVSGSPGRSRSAGDRKITSM
jgi:hypothetical protein